MAKQERIFTKENPKTKEVAHARQLIALGAVVLSALGVGWGVKHTLSDEEKPSRPTRSVLVKPGDTVFGYAEQIVEGLDKPVDVREIVDEIIALSPDAQDGVLHPGDELNVPLSDAEIVSKQDSSQK